MKIIVSCSSTDSEWADVIIKNGFTTEKKVFERRRDVDTSMEMLQKVNMMWIKSLFCLKFPPDSVSQRQNTNTQKEMTGQTPPGQSFG